MKFARKIRFWLGGLFSKGRFNAEMEDELQMHLELRIERNLAAGMSAEEARYAALRSFGGVEQIKERARDQRSVAWVENLLRDLRFAVSHHGHDHERVHMVDPEKPGGDGHAREGSSDDCVSPDWEVKPKPGRA
jgi:hypothetical protein